MFKLAYFTEKAQTKESTILTMLPTCIYTGNPIIVIIITTTIVIVVILVNNNSNTEYNNNKRNNEGMRHIQMCRP